MNEFVKSLWRNHRAKLALSIFCVLVALFDTFLKTLSPIAAGALSIALVPWVLGFIERVSLPGGFEFVFAKAEQELDQTTSEPDAEDIRAFENFKSDDPNLAIAMLRVEIERRLRQIAETVMLEPQPKNRPRTLRALANDLHKEGVISNKAHAIIFDLMPVMNDAVHGVSLRSDASEFAHQYGPKILALLKAVPTDQD